MAITYDEAKRLFCLTTRNTEYQIKINDIGIPVHAYYGRRIGGSDMSRQLAQADRGFSGNPYECRLDRGLSLDTMPQEYTGANVGDMRVSALELSGIGGSMSCDLRYAGHDIRHGKYTLKGLPYVREKSGAGDKTDTLEITLTDTIAQIEVRLLYGVFEDKDVITRTALIRNTGTEKIVLNKAASMCIDFPYADLDLIHFHGRHCMERQFERTAIGHDCISVGSRRGMSSHHNNPFVILADRNTTENCGDAYGFMLMYSGNHRAETEKDFLDSTRLVMGINDANFCWHLEPGEEFTAPEVIMTYTREGLNRLSGNYHRIIRENVIDGKYFDIKRSVLINNWEATYFDFNTEKILRLADEAHALGIDMLVLDDGWFGKRNDDNTGLGDWFVNEEKLPGGLKVIADEVNKRGMKFGLWFEPEMVNEDSELYRAHPDWALADPGRKPMLSRNQMVLDMSREDVRDYLFDSISRVLGSANIEYVKWDFNRSVANFFSHKLPAERQGELGHRFVLGTYELLDRLLKAFPKLMIEGCAGGGGRFDAGMLFYCPQIWTSDNTDPIARLKIQSGTSYGYPPCTMGAHVSASPNHQTRRGTDINTRSIVAQSGTFGYELDLSSISDEDKNEIRKQIDDFRKYDKLTRNGDYYTLNGSGSGDGFTCWEFVSTDRNEALVSIVVTDTEANAKFPYVRLRGLDEDSIYSIEGTDTEFTGAALMYGGFVFGELMLSDRYYKDEYPSMQVHFVRKDI